MKIKSYCHGATDFHVKEMPKAGSDYTCLAIINVDSVLKKDESYYPQVFWKEYKYIEREVIRHIVEDTEISSDQSDE